MDDLPVLDRARLGLASRGNTALADEFLNALFEESTSLIGRLGDLIAGDDGAAVADVAHTLKGISAELGAMRLRAAAAALEAQPQRARWGEAAERIRVALAELQAFVKP